MVLGRRGQGSMEYLGSYGWAILIVIVVGIAMYSFGLLNWNPVASPTSSGFKELQPFLPTAQARDHVFNLVGWDLNGFSVQLVNAGGSSLIMRDVNILLNDQACTTQFIWIEPDVVVLSGGPCFHFPSGLPCSEADRTVPKDVSFRVYTVEQDGFPAGTPCDHIAVGGKYVADIDVTYDISVGDLGVDTANKHSTGEIVLSGTSK